jgi:hypothetical protein
MRCSAVLDKPSILRYDNNLMTENPPKNRFLSRNPLLPLVAVMVLGVIPFILLVLPEILNVPNPMVRFLAGRDFADFWLAGRMVQEGHGDLVMHPHLYGVLFHKQFPWLAGVRLWSYPPSGLVFAALIGALSFPLAWVTFSLLGLLAMVGFLNVSPFAKRDNTWRSIGILMATLLCLPETIDNITAGQDGLIFGSMLGIVLFHLVRQTGIPEGARSLSGWQITLSGVMLGLLTIKPQMGLAVSVILVTLIIAPMTRRCTLRIAVVAVLTAAFLLGMTDFLHPHWWWLWITHVVPAQTALMNTPYGPTASQAYGGSVYILLRAFMPDWLAMNTQILVSLTVALILGALWWRRTKPDADRNTPVMPLIVASLSGSLLMTPYTLDYDQVTLQAAVLLWLILPPLSGSRHRPPIFVMLFVLAWPGWAFLASVVLHIPPLSVLAPLAALVAAIHIETRRSGIVTQNKLETPSLSMI